MKLGRNVYQNTNQAVITSAYPLSDEEIEDIGKIFPFLQNIKIKNIIDKNIIAGIVIQYRSKIIDLSIKSRLEKLKQIIYGAT